MKALVTGANGFVGQHLVDLLIGDKVRVVATGQSPTSPFGEGVEYVCVDLMDDNKVKTLPLADVGVVFHLAGLAAIGPSFEMPRKYIETNAGIQINLFEACLAQKIFPRVVVVSSGALYDPHNVLPLTEKSATSPNSPYAVSKLSQEALGYYYGTRGFEVIVARPFNHIGPGQGPGFLVPDLCKQIVEAEQSSKSKIKVGNLDSKRDYTDVRDIVRAYVLLADKGTAGEVYNVCNGSSVSGKEILNQLLALSDAAITVEEDADKLRPSDIPDLYGDYSKLHQATGWQPQIPLDQTLKDTLEFWRKRA